ncbi:hypothetical protein DFH06DRAFT_1444804 [Mycena polygramma]|nr:hypothetical protein DFH06DRAFT_1444804 [Mycena polygramma]
MHARFFTLTRTAVPRPRARILPSLSSAYISLRPPRYASRPEHLVARQRCPYSTSNESFTDPTRPDLHYHLVDPPTPLSSQLPAFALSFLPAPSSNSSTVIGWLPAATTSNEDDAGLNDFRENPEFRGVLHQAIQDGLREKVDEVQINGALQLGNGWMHIHGMSFFLSVQYTRAHFWGVLDERNVPALGRIGDPDDIIATVLVQDGEIQPETYQPMSSYRICTSDGPTQLTPGLAKKLQAVLEERARSAQ